MKITFIISEDFVNYKKACMFIGIPYCDGKCNKDANKIVCQNNNLDTAKEVSTEYIIKSYLNNPITHAVVIGGREPFYKSFPEVLELVKKLREVSLDDIVIYTGYTEEELKDKIELLKQYPNIIVKFGRFHYDSTPRYDELLGITLASNNQYAKQIN